MEASVRISLLRHNELIKIEEAMDALKESGVIKINRGYSYKLTYYFKNEKEALKEIQSTIDELLKKIDTIKNRGFWDRVWNDV